MKAKVEEMSDCDSARCLLEGGDGFSSPAGAAGTVISGEVKVPPSQASAPFPVESTGWGVAGADAFPGGYQAFPVIRGAIANTHQALSWKALMDLRDRPVEYDIFESKWTQLARRVVAQNTVLGQCDPRHVIGMDELLGTGNIADLNRQVALDPLVAENWLRGDGGFGSTGLPQVHWTIVMTKEHPEKVCTLSIPGATLPEIHLCGILDTGTDITIVSLVAWPLEWPLDPVQTSIVGSAGMAQCCVSQRPVMIMNPEGQTVMVWPHVTIEARANLWGRDLLAVWGVRIGMDF
ncbi:hypothetical protein HGM15179_018756 [Zosterops borbonicus]|uniref:Peptidase A2 domain-containing protein n=1 Tax=Zosterops borbonicus TaxID=364589 RepID=A0A8K1FWF4_9PASS|nr:hypothetical protein HGM15179_018756 [Zosterops borbonicus]